MLQILLSFVVSRCFAEEAKIFTKIYKALAQPLSYSLNLLFSDVPVDVAVKLPDNLNWSP